MPYLPLLIINLSLVLQLISAFVAVHLIVHSTKRAVGVIMLLAAALMTFRRGISLHRFLSVREADLFAEIIACLVSFLLLIGFLYLTRLIGRLQHEAAERSRAESIFREANARLQTLLHAIPDIVVFKDVEGRHLMANRAAEQFMGLQQGKLADRTAEQLLPPDLAAQCREGDREAMNSAGPVRTEEQWMGKDGKPVFFDTIKTAIRDGEGTLTGLVSVSRDVTGRKQTEEKILHLSRQKELILNAAGEGIYGVDREGNITFINHAAAQMVGWTAEELIGRSSHDLLHHSRPDGTRYPPEECPLFKALTSRACHYGLEETIWRKDGSCLPIEYISTPIEQNDSVLGAVVVFRDISGRKQAEEEIKADQRRLNSLLKISQQKSASPRELLSAALDEAIALSDSVLGFINYYCEEKQEFTLHAWSSLVMEECTIPDPPRMWRLDSAGVWAEAVRQREPVVINDFSTGHPLGKGFPEGHARITRFMSLPVFSDGRVVAVVGVANKSADYTDLDVRQLSLMTDSVWKIAERRTAEEALRISEERVRLALAGANQGLYDLNIRTGEAEVSPEYAIMLGYNPDEFRETNTWWIERLHPDDRERVSAVFRNYISGKIPAYSVEFRQRTKAGGWKWILSVGKIVQRDERGAPVRMLGTHTDITERRQLLEQLEGLNRNLAERVREEIEKNRAKEQVLQLQSRHAAMGEMIDNIAHQWRQPLNNLGLIMQAIERKFVKGDLTPELMQERTRTGMALIRYMSQTICDFSNFFRHDKETVTFRIREVVATALGFMETSLKRNAIAVKTDIPDDLTVRGYRNEYAQVVVNILNNARDVFLERAVRDPVITLRAFREDAFSVLSIRDNGGGIPADMIDRIFLPYCTTKPRSKGTGIGLHMSRTIIENNMKGRLSACNAPGGAEFRIEVRDGR